jgi:lactate dehydrogenase-like 2-hydroxyacid dehydrogenase
LNVRLLDREMPQRKTGGGHIGQNVLGKATHANREVVGHSPRRSAAQAVFAAAERRATPVDVVWSLDFLAFVCEATSRG